jgi:bifunctional non-homologous end joining protein LigD
MSGNRDCVACLTTRVREFGFVPAFIKPQLATLKTKAPTGAYLHEIKYDGYRVQVHSGKHAYTRNGHDWVKRFSLIVGALDIPPAIIDGEVVVVYEGRTNFSELQAELAKGSQERLLYYAFDYPVARRQRLSCARFG